MSDFIVPWKAILEIGSKLLGQPKVQRAKFRETIVDPLNEKFEEMYANHVEAFKQVRAMIIASRPAEEIGSFVRATVLFEQDVTEVLYAFTRRDQSWRHVPRGDELNEAFIEYIASIANCLRSPNPGSTTLIYYISLVDLTETLPNVSPEESVRGLDVIITRFQRFYGEVKTNYLRLQRLCSI